MALLGCEAAEQGRPLLVAFDDAHLLDAQSWQLLLSVQEALHPTFLMTYWRQDRMQASGPSL